MRLPLSWEKLLEDSIDLNSFYTELVDFLDKFITIIPVKEKILHVFEYMHPADVKCVLFGEDPYPRITSACGVAFWDKEIVHWQDKTHGNSLKNILKALLVYKGLAQYTDSIEVCRSIAAAKAIKSPPELFKFWLEQGILLINSAMTFSSKADKKIHMAFWKKFHEVLITKLNSRNESPYYLLWGKKAQLWEKTILESVDDSLKIIKQGHPTFIHQFMNANDPEYSPFFEIFEKTKLKWI